MNRSSKPNLNPSPASQTLHSGELNPAERVAALADSALSEADSQAVIDQLLASPELCAHWHDLHRAGDYLRSDEMAFCDADAAFWQGFSNRLDQEPTLLAPKPVKRSTRRAWMRYGLPGASMAAAVAMVSWLSFPQFSGNGNDMVVTNNSTSSTSSKATDRSPQPVATMPPGATSISASAPVSAESLMAENNPAASTSVSAKPVDPRELRNYLAAHQQFSSTPFRGPGAVQAASFNTIRTED